MDYSDYLYRLQHTRQMTPLPAYEIVLEQTYPIGTILQSNENYLRYQGEIEIVLCAIPYDERYIVVGKVIDEDVALLPHISDYAIQLVKS